MYIINVKKDKKCAMCTFYDQSCVKSYDPRSGKLTVDNSGRKCPVKKISRLASSSVCEQFKRDPKY